MKGNVTIIPMEGTESVEDTIPEGCIPCAEMDGVLFRVDGSAREFTPDPDKTYERVPYSPVLRALITVVAGCNDKKIEGFYLREVTQ